MIKFLNWTNRYLIYLSVAVMILAAGWIVISAPEPSETTGGQTPAPREGFLAPDFSLSTVTGETIQLRGLTDKVVILNLWATWCPPCRAEMPALQQVAEDYAERGLVVLTVNMTTQDNLNDVKVFVDDFKINTPVLLDLDGSVSDKYQVRALPTTFFLGQGNIINKVVIGGPLSESLLRVEVEKLLEGME